MSYDTEDIREKYERLVRAAFPMVELRTDLTPPEPDGLPVIDALGIPDDRMHEFHCFTLDVLPDLSGELDLPVVGIVRHSESDTKRRYPKLCRQGAVAK